MMTNVLCRSTSLVLYVHKSISACHIITSVGASLARNNRCNNPSGISFFHNGHAKQAAVKRSQNATGGALCDDLKLVTAYSLSEELKIEQASKLLDNLHEYEQKQLPRDIENQALMLSLRDPKTTSGSTRSPHDIFIFREGSIVFWGVPSQQQKRVLHSLTSLKIDPHSSDLTQEEKEQIHFEMTDSSEKSRLNRDILELSVKKDPQLQRLDQFACSHAVALSVKLAIWETIVDRYIDSVGQITNVMKSGKRIQLTSSEVFRKTGELYELKHRIILDSDLLDLPDIYWDRYEQEVLFMSLVSFLNVKRRTAVIDEKLNNCCELMNLLAVHINDKHHIRLEWMIIALIMVEVLFELARFAKDKHD